MDIRLLEEATATLRRAANSGVDRRQKDVYYEMSSKMKVVLQSMYEQQQKLKQIAYLADQVHNSNLAETFQQMVRKMNQELQEAEAVIRQMRNIAN